MSNEPSPSVDDAAKLGLTQLIPTIYQDALQPGVKQLGQALNSAVSLIPMLMLPAQYVSEAAKAHLTFALEDLRKKLALRSSEKTVSIRPELAVPILNRLAYTQDESLVSLFTELLAKAAFTDTAQLAHPSFTRIIESLSPDEALILRLFASMLDKDEVFNDIAFEIVEVRKPKSDGMFAIVMGPLTSWANFIELSTEDNIPSYVVNLARLGLISCDFTKGLAHTNDDRLFVDVKPFTSQGFEVLKGVCTLTAFGELFLRACVQAHSVNS
jgi:Abortive infection alpha